MLGLTKINTCKYFNWFLGLTSNTITFVKKMKSSGLFNSALLIEQHNFCQLCGQTTKANGKTDFHEVSDKKR